MASANPRPSAKPAVLMFITILIKAFRAAALPGLPV